MNDTTQLLRQINPSFLLEDGKVSSGAFNPSRNHDFKLSTYSGDKFTPKESFDHAKSGGLSSEGVMAITKKECDDLGELEVVQDDEGFNGHCSIDFEKVSSRGKRKKKAGRLRDLAEARGWLYPTRP